MSIKGIKRCEILKTVDENQITQKEGARRVDVSPRHFHRFNGMALKSKKIIQQSKYNLLADSKDIGIYPVIPDP